MRKSILLTGATGFVGKQLMQLLVKHGHHVYIVVRNKLGKTPEQRLAQLVDEELRTEVTLINGDLSQDGAGISQEDLDLMHGEVDTVIHSAALVKFDQDLADELQEINVEGTRRMLEVATAIEARNFYYVSTAYTAGRLLDVHEELHPIDGEFHNPYERTKCTAEHLVAGSANDRMHTAIFRPSVIIGDSKTGLADTSLTIYGFIKGIRLFSRKMGKEFHNRTFRLQADPHATQNVVPVDYVCEALAAAVDQGVQGGVYHVTNPEPPTNEQIFDTILAKLGLNKDAIEVCKELRAEDMSAEEQWLNSLVETYRVYLYNNAHFHDDNLRRLLATQGKETLQLDQQKLEFIISAYKARG